MNIPNFNFRIGELISVKDPSTANGNKICKIYAFGGYRKIFAHSSDNTPYSFTIDQVEYPTEEQLMIYMLER